MAKAVLNSGLEQIRGAISEWVYKVMYGKRIIARRPVPDPLRVPTANQVASRQRFSDAAAYGRSVIADPDRRVFYQQVATAKDQPVFSVIVGDFFTPPVIHAIDLAGYNGQIGGKIVVRASDDVQVASARVAIRDTATNAAIEAGAAVLVGADWVYTATTALAAGQSVTIQVTVVDRPGNETMQEKVYP